MSGQESSEVCNAAGCVATATESRRRVPDQRRLSFCTAHARLHDQGYTFTIKPSSGESDESDDAAQDAPSGGKAIPEPRCPNHPDRPVAAEIEGRVLVCQECVDNPELRDHAERDWR